MHNPYLNGGSDSDESSSSSQHITQASTSNQDSQQNGEQSQQAEGYQPQPTARNEKHILYLDDYTTTDSPPSYSVTQEHYETPKSSDVDTRRLPVEEIPLDPYYAQSPVEPESAPLLPEEGEYTLPAASSPIDQVVFTSYNPFDKSRRVRKYSIINVLLGLAIFVSGICIMATALATLKCYSLCNDDQECNECQNKLHKGLMASGFSFFILTSVCIIWKIIQLAVCEISFL